MNTRQALCSSGTAEPLAGTAKPGTLILALEHFGGWGRDILDGDALGPELTTRITTFLKNHGAQLQFIRKPGKTGQERKNRPTRSLYIAWCNGDNTPHSQAVLEYLEVTGPEDILTLDLSTPGATPGATIVNEPILLVCTHGKRDRCCALFGRPLAAELATTHTNVWESSHTKGHRFAPSMILLPSNYSYGHLYPRQARFVLNAATQHSIALTGNRGKGTLDPISQVAELAMLHHLATTEAQATDTMVREGLVTVYRPGDTQPAHLAGKPTTKEHGTTTRRVITRTHPNRAKAAGYQEKQWTVHLEQQTVGPVIASCGDEKKDATVWVASSIEPQ